MIEFGTVFGTSGNGSVDRLNVTNLVVSKSQRKITVEVANELSDVIKNLAISQIVKSTGNANIELKTDPKYKKRQKT